MYLNKVTLIGNLTRDPELKAMPSGIKVINFSIATNRSWKDKNTGEKKEDVEFHNLVAFGKTAEIIGQYVHKGDQIFIDGRLQTRSWDDKETGKKQYKTEVVVDTFQFGAKSSKARVDDGKGRTTAPASENQATGQESTGIDYPTEEINPEDIPF